MIDTKARITINRRLANGERFVVKTRVLGSARFHKDELPISSLKLDSRGRLKAELILPKGVISIDLSNGDVIESIPQRWTV